MPDEMKRIDVIMGPYRGNLLQVSAADFDSAINNHWARDPYPPPAPAPEPGKQPEPEPALSDEQRQAALEAAQAWAQAQWDLASGTTPKDAKPAASGEYVTRQQATKR
jgi:hypothetical protein